MEQRQHRKLVVAGSDGTLGAFLKERLGAEGLRLRCAAGEEGLPADGLADAEVVVNATGPRVRPGLSWADYHREHVGCAARLARSMSAGGHLVHLSSTAVYGARGTWLDVASAEAPLRFPNPAYACAKLAAEGILQRTCGERGVRLSVLRLSTVYGAGIDSVLETMLRLARRGVAMRLGPGNLPQHWLRSDVLAAVVSKVAGGEAVPLAIVADPYVLSSDELHAALRRAAPRSVSAPVPVAAIGKAIGLLPRHLEPPGALAALAVLGLGNELEVAPLFDRLGLDPRAFGREGFDALFSS